jgi:hypothetical protein
MDALDLLAFALESVPPHFPKETRSDRAYGLIHAATHLQLEIEKAGQHGDSWMYEGVQP